MVWGLNGALYVPLKTPCYPQPSVYVPGRDLLRFPDCPWISAAPSPSTELRLQTRLSWLRLIIFQLLLRLLALWSLRGKQLPHSTSLQSVERQWLSSNASRPGCCDVFCTLHCSSSSLQKHIDTMSVLVWYWRQLWIWASTLSMLTREGLEWVSSIPRLEKGRHYAAHWKN